ICYNKSRARNAGTQGGSLLGKSDLVNAEDVTDGIAIPVQDHGRHGLLLLQLVYLLGELLHLLMKVIVGRRPIIVGHEPRPNEQEYRQHTLYQPLPCATDRFFFRLQVVGHEGKAACAAGEEIARPGRPMSLYIAAGAATLLGYGGRCTAGVSN